MCVCVLRFKVQCSSQRQLQRAVLSQTSKHSCSFNYILTTASKENGIHKSGGAPLFHSLVEVCVMASGDDLLDFRSPDLSSD